MLWARESVSGAGCEPSGGRAVNVTRVPPTRSIADATGLVKETNSNIEAAPASTVSNANA